LASDRPEEAPNLPGASHRVTSEPLKKEKAYHFLLFYVFVCGANKLILILILSPTPQYQNDPQKESNSEE